MSNPRTTILGYLAIAASAVMFFTKLFKGEPVTLDELLAIGSMVSAGAASISAKDGGH